MVSNDNNLFYDLDPVENKQTNTLITEGELQ